jgi:hypothetical protein
MPDRFVARRPHWPLRLVLLGLLAVSALPILSCSNGGECDKCSVDEDCKSGLVCSTFSDDSKRCGSGTGATQCRVR